MDEAEGLPKLAHLRGVVAIARVGTVSRAAREVALSQPALTQGLARVEAAAGVALFIRAQRGLVLTDPGRAFTARARRGLDLLARGAQIAGRNNLDRIASVSQYRALIAVVETGGFRPAAAVLGREASTIGRACRTLERIAGVALFEQTSAGLRPTRQAEALAHHGKLALAEFRQALDDASGWRGRVVGRLAIGCLPLAQASIVPAALTRFAADFPAVAPKVVDGTYASLARALLRGDLDFIVGALRADDLPDGLVQTELFRAPLSVVADPAHPLAGLSDVTPDMLARHPWVAPRAGAPSRTYFEAMHAALDVPDDVPRPIETGSHSVMIGLLHGSGRLTVISDLQVERELATGALSRIGPPLAHSLRPIGVTVRTDFMPSAPHSRFLEALREVVGGARAP